MNKESGPLQDLKACLKIDGQLFVKQKILIKIKSKIKILGVFR